MLKNWQLWLVAVMLVVAGFFASIKHVKTELPEFGLVPEFQFQDQNGNAFSSESLKNKVWIAGFIFTRCKGPCPLISSKMAELKKRLSYSDRLALVSFSVDPEYDTPEKLAAYAEKFSGSTSSPQEQKKGPQWHFLTGAKEKIYELAVKTFMQTASNDETQVDIQKKFAHGTRLALIDSQGRIRGFYDSQDSNMVQALELDIRAIL